jgi:hypothetical protein
MSGISPTTVNNYRDRTHELNTYNEIANLNNYLNLTNKQEVTRLTRTNDSLKSSILKARQQYMINDRNYELIRFKCKVLYFSIIVLCIVFLIVGLQLLGMFPSSLGGIIIILLLAMYFIIVLLWMFNNSERRNINWNQYYWPDIEKK